MTNPREVRPERGAEKRSFSADVRPEDARPSEGGDPWAPIRGPRVLGLYGPGPWPAIRGPRLEPRPNLGPGPYRGPGPLARYTRAKAGIQA